MGFYSFMYYFIYFYPPDSKIYFGVICKCDVETMEEGGEQRREGIQN